MLSIVVVSDFQAKSELAKKIAKGESLVMIICWMWSEQSVFETLTISHPPFLIIWIRLAGARRLTSAASQPPTQPLICLLLRQISEVLSCLVMQTALNNKRYSDIWADLPSSGPQRTDKYAETNWDFPAPSFKEKTGRKLLSSSVNELPLCLIENENKALNLLQESKTSTTAQVWVGLSGWLRLF